MILPITVKLMVKSVFIIEIKALNSILSFLTPSYPKIPASLNVLIPITKPSIVNFPLPFGLANIKLN